MPPRGPREIELSIDALGPDGLGEGRFDGRAVKARNALPGETVAMRVLKRRRGVWFGEADAPVHPSAMRQPAPCPNYPRCGGCVMQHVAYPAQLEHKAAQLRVELAARGVSARRWRPPASGPQFHYRYKARLGVRLLGDELLAGFREGFSNRVARMDDCKTLALPFARMLADLQDTLAALRGCDRIPQVELAGGDQEFAVVVRHLTELKGSDREILRRFARRSGMRVFLQPGGYDTVAPLDDEGTARYLCYANPDYGVSFEFLPTDFTQVNPYVNRSLVRAALLALAPPPGSRVVDLFCGIGNFSLALARLGTYVHGFELAEGAVARARRNAYRNALCAQAEFAVADLYDARCPELPEAEFMLLDPPRSGAGPNLETWARAPALQRLAYVSCNPRTFASDAVRLTGLGFELQEAGVFDMFPHTAHVETLGLFHRTGAPSGG